MTSGHEEVWQLGATECGVKVLVGNLILWIVTCLVVILIAVQIYGSIRMVRGRPRSGGSAQARRRGRWIYVAVMCSMMLPIIVVGLYVAGHGVVGLLVLLAYVVLVLVWTVLRGTILTTHRNSRPPR
jgi:hypothetical protein